MKRISVLIADDSSLARMMIREIIESDPQMHVCAEAKNGTEAVHLTGEFRPDLITMDIHMPVTGGLESIEQIMSRTPTPILVLTDRDDVKTAFEAISRGALEVAAKPRPTEQERRKLIEKIRMLAAVKVIRHYRKDEPGGAAPKKAARLPVAAESFTVVGIGSSTGGPKALAEILQRMPADTSAAILIAQHIGWGFSQGLASWLDQVSPLQIHIAESGQRVLPSHVYIAPDSYHIGISGTRRIDLTRRRDDDIYTPSCDMLFRSLAEYESKTGIGIILSGMGKDGTAGLQDLHRAGGFTIAQDEMSSAIFGMPGSAIEAGCIDSVQPLKDIPDLLQVLINRRSGR